MSTLGALLILTGTLLAFAALWGWQVHDFRRFNREHPRVESEPAEDVDFAEALRCRGGRLTPPAPPLSTPLLDAYRERS